MRTFTQTIAVLLTTLFAASSYAADVTVTIDGIKNNDGKIVAGLFDNPATFPRGKVVTGQMTPAIKGAVTVIFKDVAAGRYAISAYHDVNGNGRLDANMMGIPSEPYGFSRDALGQMGPPKFEDAAFTVDKSPVSLTIHVK